MNAEEIKQAREICDKARENPRLYSSEIVFTVLPAALDEIERLQEENAKLKKALAECAGY